MNNSPLTAVQRQPEWFAEYMAKNANIQPVDWRGKEIPESPPESSNGSLTLLSVGSAVATVVFLPEIAAGIAGTAAVLGIGYIFIMLYEPKSTDEPNYITGPRGGRYTMEQSHDGGEYRRYR